MCVYLHVSLNTCAHAHTHIYLRTYVLAFVRVCKHMLCTKAHTHTMSLSLSFSPFLLLSHTHTHKHTQRHTRKHTRTCSLSRSLACSLALALSLCRFSALALARSHPPPLFSRTRIHTYRLQCKYPPPTSSAAPRRWCRQWQCAGAAVCVRESRVSGGVCTCADGVRSKVCVSDAHPGVAKTQFCEYVLFVSVLSTVATWKPSTCRVWPSPSSPLCRLEPNTYAIPLCTDAMRRSLAWCRLHTGPCVCVCVIIGPTSIAMRWVFFQCVCMPA